jgi:hypothetical protein
MCTGSQNRRRPLVVVNSKRLVVDVAFCRLYAACVAAAGGLLLIVVGQESSSRQHNDDIETPRRRMAALPPGVVVGPPMHRSMVTRARPLIKQVGMNRIR